MPCHSWSAHFFFLPACGGDGGPTALTDTLCGSQPGTTRVTFEDANLAAAIRAALALGDQGDFVYLEHVDPAMLCEEVALLQAKGVDVIFDGCT